MEVPDKHFSLLDKWFENAIDNKKNIPTSWTEAWERVDVNSYPELNLPDISSLTPEVNMEMTYLKPIPPGAPKDYPEKIPIKESGRQFYYKFDTKFKVPKVCANFQFNSPNDGFSNIYSIICLNIFAECFQTLLFEKTYPFLLTGYSVSVLESHWGISIKLSGFNHGMHSLLTIVMQQMLDFEKDLTSEVFAVSIDP